MPEHDTTPLFTATIDQLIDELDRRTATLVVGFTYTDEAGERYQVVTRGTITGRQGMGAMIAGALAKELRKAVGA